MFLTEKTGHKNRGRAWDNPAVDHQLCSCPIFLISLLIILGSIWRIHLATSCEECTVWVGVLCSAAGNFVPTPRIGTS